MFVQKYVKIKLKFTRKTAIKCLEILVNQACFFFPKFVFDKFFFQIQIINYFQKGGP